MLPPSPLSLSLTVFTPSASIFSIYPIYCLHTRLLSLRLINGSHSDDSKESGLFFWLEFRRLVQ